MRLPLELLSLASLLLAPLTAATSTKRNPLGALSVIHNATIHSPNHRITALSEFDLTFIANNDLHVKLSLEPNHDMFRRDTLITHLGPDGEVEHQQTIDRKSHKVFKGTAWVRDSSNGRDDWERVGWARALIRRDGPNPFFEGAFAAHLDSHHIQSSTNFLQTKHRLDPEIDRFIDGEEYMVLWRDSDILNNDALSHEELRRSLNDDSTGCGSHRLYFNRHPDHPALQGLFDFKRYTTSYSSSNALDPSRLFGKRQIDTTTGGSSSGVDLQSTIGNPAGCPTTRKVALVGVATDCSYTAELGSNDAVTSNVISQMNLASGAFEEAFNISLGLQNLTISSPSCPAAPSTSTRWNQACSDSVNIEDRLNYFSGWRSEQGGNNSHWTLLSTCNTNSIIGLAWLGQVCVGTATSSNGSLTGNGISSGSSGETVSGANVVVRTDGTNEWAIIAHETNHVFGGVHDCDSTTCEEHDYVSSQRCCPYTKNTCSANSQFIMNPYANIAATKFSPCSVGNICSAIGRNAVNTACLRDNEDVHLFTGADCGNGIVEEGEQCDCGGITGCGDDSCCDPTTCRFTSGSVCDDANEVCCNNCQFQTKGTVCRPSSSSCDPAEYCPGDAGNCPPNDLAPNGQDCGSGLKCASGQCTSRNQQCTTVMGSYTNGNNDTYACDSEGCTISCASPAFGPGVCYGLQQNFLDGTPCGGGGSCLNGQCRGQTTAGEAKAWIDDNKPIVIGIAVAVGVVLLFIIIGCLSRCFRRRKQPKTTTPAPPPEGWQGWNRHGAPQMSQGPSQGWYGPKPPGFRPSRPPWEGSAPLVPPPAYAPPNGVSVRYA